MAETLRLSEPVAADAHSETFGAPLDDSLPKFTLDELMREAEMQVGREVLITAKVGKVCRKKGCFFMAYDGEHALRVAFIDYSFFVPTDAGGKQVDFAGKLIKREVTVEQAKHYAKDLGEPKARMVAILATISACESGSPIHSRHPPQLSGSDTRSARR